MELLIIVLIFAAAAAAVILIARKIASHRFKCRHCSGEFRVNWPRIIITEHSASEYKLVCPLCGAKDWCRELH